MRSVSDTITTTLTVMALVGGLVLPAGAEPLVVIDFSGSVSSVEGALASEFSVGDVLSISVTVDTGAPDIVSSPTIGGYPGAVVGFAGSIGTYTFSGSTGEAIIENDTFGVDAFGLFNMVPTVAALVNGNVPTRLDIDSRDSTGTALSSKALAPQNWILSEFASNRFAFTFFDGEAFPHVIASLDSIEVTVPGPASLVVLGIGLLAIGAQQAFRRRLILRGRPNSPGAVVPS
jgi:hypothetical protein